ncbi:hypothetical protein BJ138DRAFT_1105946 [Hygrophoropsis aurantiaca]|uniref:Uncharacterized protein n=1 Tax=Hygrophoropsis aurantiaca TaxID=72124 RepID=A0ACB7ZYP8_9AGAM|nr:hypothetical protein BJ138DRAFT_1105946 [Hygrophoropsis aurantiaca]
MLQYPATESNPSGSTQPTAGIETEADRSSLLGLSEYGSEGFEYVRAALHKRAHPHEVINAHYPHRTALSAPRAVTRTDAAHGLAFSTSLNAFESTVGVAEILDPTGAPRTTQFPARAFDTFLDAGPKQVELSWEGPVGVALSSSLTADDTSYLSIWTSATIFWTSVGFAPGTSDIPPATSVVYATSILVLTSTSEPPRRQTSYETYNTPSSSQWQTTDENYTSISSSQWQTTSESLTATSGSHPMTSQSHTPSLGIIAGSAAGGTTVLIAASPEEEW